MMARDFDGSVNLRWIWRFQLALIPLGALAWVFKSLTASIIFFLGGILSLLWWQMHKWGIARMLTPSKKRRWLFGFMGVLKLGLIAILLRVIVNIFPMEALPFVTGLLLFVVAIMLEAARLIFRHFRSAGYDEN